MPALYFCLYIIYYVFAYRISHTEHDFMKHNITYYSIYPESFFEPKAEKELKVKVANLVKEGLANGSVVPSLTTPFTELEKAVRYVVFFTFNSLEVTFEDRRD